MSGIKAFLYVLGRAPRAQKRNFLLAQLGVVFIVAAQLMIPQLVQDIIDDGVLADSTDAVVWSSFQMLLWSVANLIVAGGVAYLSAATATNLANEIRTRLYEKVTTLSHGNLDRLSTGNLLVRMTSDVNIMKSSWMMTMYMLFQAPWLLLGAVALVWWQTPQLLWIVGLVMGLTMIFVLIVAPALGPMYAKVQVQLDRLNTTVAASSAPTPPNTTPTRFTEPLPTPEAERRASTPPPNPTGSVV